MQLTLDAGNSSVKFGLFDNSVLINFGRLNYGDNLEDFLSPNKLSRVKTVIYSSVVTNPEIKNLPKVNTIKIDHNSKFPFQNNYKTPSSLGVDRLVACVGAHKPGQNTLVIDAGSCITFDYVSEEFGYEGGAISPGLKMRFQSMNNFTDQLPLVSEFENHPKMLGNTTIECLKSGVVNGIKAEINSFISHFEMKNKNLKVFLTGGDSSFLCTELKSGIFADQNLVLKGLINLIKLNE